MFRSIIRTPFHLSLLAILLLPITASASDLAVVNAWASIPGPFENPSAYFAIQSKSTTTRTLVSASSPRCDWIELLRAVLKDGVMGTEKLDKIEIPAGGAVAFVPRGLSLSLVGLESLAVGESVTIELKFADGEKLEVKAIGRDQ